MQVTARAAEMRMTFLKIIKPTNVNIYLLAVQYEYMKRDSHDCYGHDIDELIPMEEHIPKTAWSGATTGGTVTALLSTVVNVISRTKTVETISRVLAAEPFS